VELCLFDERGRHELCSKPRFDLGRRPPPRACRWKDTVFYEVHVRGFTMMARRAARRARHLRRPGSAPAIAHLKRAGRDLGRAAAGARFNDERRLIDLGLANYWGYNTMASSRRSRATAPATTSTSSSAWSRRCTRPGSR
jgi:pullulanase/glycogen debranching enzyme